MMGGESEGTRRKRHLDDASRTPRRASTAAPARLAQA